MEAQLNVILNSRAMIEGTSNIGESEVKSEASSSQNDVIAIETPRIEHTEAIVTTAHGTVTHVANQNQNVFSTEDTSETNNSDER